MSSSSLTYEPGVATRSNRLLAQLPDADIERLRPYLEAVNLEDRETIYRPDSPMDHVYFPVSGLLSTIAGGSDGMTVEAFAIGRDGTTGVMPYLGWSESPFEVVQQIAGSTLRMRTDDFRAEVDRGSALSDLVAKYARHMIISISQTIVCGRLHALRSRAARWLLECHDAVDGDTFRLTHEFFATMLGVHRPTVTLAAGTLQATNVIGYTRGVLTVIDRARLEEAACDCYAAVRDDYARAFGGAGKTQ